jgi:hypothetical protein
MAKKEPLRLAAHDREDLAVISALLQDSVARLGDLAYIVPQRRFAAVFNRFRWEDKSRGAGQRIRTEVNFRGILDARTMGLTLNAKEQLVELLAIHTQDSDSGTVHITMIFSGGGAIRLEAECVDCEINDISYPWRASARPSHSAESAE